VSARLTPEAEADLAEVVRWYQSHGVQIVERFRRAVTSGLALIDQYPSGQPVLYRTVRRVLVPRFPYVLLYYLDPDGPVVFGCFHSARDPRSWQERSDAALD
jgi:plasmid stabilization system protein ParE